MIDKRFIYLIVICILFMPFSLGSEIYDDASYTTFDPSSGDTGLSCNDNIVGYLTNHVVVLHNTLHNSGTIEPSLMIDLDMKKSEIINANFAPGSMGYFQEYIYQGGWCEIPDTRYPNKRDLLPTIENLPFLIDSVSYSCNYTENETNTFQYIFFLNQTKSLQSYLSCDYNLGQNNLTLALQIDYVSNPDFLNKNGRPRAIYREPTWTGEGKNIYRVSTYTLEDYVEYRDTGGYGYVPDTIDFSQLFEIPVSLNNITGTNITESNFSYIDTGDSEYNNQSSELSNIEKIADKNTEAQDNLEIQKQATTNQKMQAMRKNYSVIDFFIGVCEFIISLILILYYLIVIAFLIFIMTTYVPKIVMLVPTVIERMIFKKEGGNK